MTHTCVTRTRCVDIFRPKQSYQHFWDDIFKRIFLNKLSGFYYDIFEICSQGPNDNANGVLSEPIAIIIYDAMRLNSLRPRLNRRPLADDIFKCIFFNENVWISIKISLKFVPKGPINNIPALVQIMAWRRPGDKPLSEPMMVSLLTHQSASMS